MDDDELSNKLRAWGERAILAQAAAAQALARLLDQAERGNSGQARHIAQFLASSYNGQTFPFDLFTLRAVDVEICDDMLKCIDALRWGKADLYKLVPDGEQRIQMVIELWGISER